MAKKYQVVNVEMPVPSAQEVVGGFDTKEAAKDYALQFSAMHSGLYSVRENPNYMEELIAENTVAMALRDASRAKRRAER